MANPSLFRQKSVRLHASMITETSAALQARDDCHGMNGSAGIIENAALASDARAAFSSH